MQAERDTLVRRRFAPDPALRGLFAAGALACAAGLHAATPAEFAARIREDRAKWNKLVTAIGLKAGEGG